MSFEEARGIHQAYQRKRPDVIQSFIANNEVTKAIADQYGEDDVFAKTHLWYARFKKGLTDFPAGTWKTYTTLAVFLRDELQAPRIEAAVLHRSRD
jgi:hypothetical protein